MPFAPPFSGMRLPAQSLGPEDTVSRHWPLPQALAPAGPPGPDPASQAPAPPQPSPPLSHWRIPKTQASVRSPGLHVASLTPRRAARGPAQRPGPPESLRNPWPMAPPQAVGQSPGDGASPAPRPCAAAQDRAVRSQGPSPRGTAPAGAHAAPADRGAARGTPPVPDAPRASPEGREVRRPVSQAASDASGAESVPGRQEGASGRPAPRQYIPLSQRDMQALSAFAPITVGYRLGARLDPASLCQSLACACGQFPGTLGRLVTRRGQRLVETPWHEVGIRNVEVPSQALGCRVAWQQVFDAFPLRAAGEGGTELIGENLFQVRCVAALDSGERKPWCGRHSHSSMQSLHPDLLEGAPPNPSE